MKQKENKNGIFTYYIKYSHEPQDMGRGSMRCYYL